MKITLNRKISPSILNLSDIKKICSIINDIFNQEKLKGFTLYREPSFQLILKSGRTYDFDNADHFIEQIEVDLLNIKEIYLSYWGRKTTITLRMDTGLFSEIGLMIQAEDKSNLLGDEEDILSLFRKKSLNDIPRKFFVNVASALLIVSSSITIISKIWPSIALSSFLFGIILGLVLISLLFIQERLYPALAINIDEKYKGRVFKNDIWKLSIGILSFIILPILIDGIKKKIGF